MRRLLGFSALLFFCFSTPQLACAQSGTEWLAQVRAQREAMLVDAKALRANPDRSYPPSCVTYPLSTTAHGPVVSRTVSVGDFDSFNYSEQVAVSVWRLACSGGKSAVMVRLARPQARQNLAPAPDVPVPNVVHSGQQDIPLRLSIEPNTYYSEVLGHSIVNDVALVLETIPGVPFDLNQSFTLALDTFYGNAAHRETFSIAAYNAASHPDGAQNLEINGYLTGSWYDSTRSGEGIFYEVGERSDGSRFVFFSWFTYKPSGDPYWIVGTTDVAAGARTVTVPAFYFDHGGFAGNFNPGNLQNKPWGNVSFNFPSCGVMTLQFASTHADAGVPSGSGIRAWTRLSSINGFVCE